MVRFRPGKLAYLSESDTEVEKDELEPTKQCTALSKRASPRTPALSNCEISQIRSSERIRGKQSQSFEKPTRQQLMSKIETLKSPSKMLERLKPRRLVNDFTKERHRYNYDPDFTSGESSIDDFIDDDDSESKACSSSDESSVLEETQSPVPPTKSKNDDQRPTKGKESNVTKCKFTQIKVKGSKVTEENPGSSEDEQNNVSESQTLKTDISKGSTSDSNDDIVNSSAKTRAILSSSDTNSSDSDVVQPGQRRNRKRRRHKNVDTGSPQPGVVAQRHSAKRKLHMFSEGSEASDANTDNQVESTSNNTDEESGEQEDDDDENDSGSDVNKLSSSRSGNFYSRRAELMQRKRDKKRKLFSKLIQTRKRKKSN